MCPGGNGYYMSTGDAIGGLIITLIITSILVLIGVCIAVYLKRKNIDREYLWMFIGIVILFALLNSVQYIGYII